MWKLTAAAGIGLAAGLTVWGPQLERADPVEDAALGAVLLLDLMLGIICLVLVAVRHQALVTITTVIALLAGFSSFSTGAFLLAVVSLSIRRRALLLVPPAVAAAAGMTVGQPLLEVSGGEPLSLWWVPAWVAAAFVVPVLSGWVIGSRRDLHQSLRREAEAARSERHAAEERARTEERNRIAREFHDELGHRLSLIALHAGAMEYREDMDRAQVREGAGVIRQSAHRAMIEVRSTLDLLRETPAEHGEPHSSTTTAEPEPSPDVHQRLEALAREVTETGSEVDLRISAELDRLPGHTGRHLYRVVQEALTNAMRHAPSAPVRVEVSGTPGDRLRVVVINPTPLPQQQGPAPEGSGLGLVGAKERARLAGGELTVDPGERPGAEFAVRAWFPWTK